MPTKTSKPPLKGFKIKPQKNIHECEFGDQRFICTLCGQIMNEHDREIFHPRKLPSEKLDPIEWVKQFYKKLKNPYQWKYKTGCPNENKYFSTYFDGELPSSIQPFVRKRDRRAKNRIEKM